MKTNLEREVKRQHELLQQNIRYMAELEKMEVDGSQTEKRRWGLG